MRYIVWIDGMDGDFYEDLATALEAIQHAFNNGAKLVRMASR